MYSRSDSGITGSGGRRRAKEEDERPQLGQLIPIPLTRDQVRELGFRLQLPNVVLQSIESDHCGNENKQKRAIFKAWLERDEKASWSRLLQALRQVSRSLHDEVRYTYIDASDDEKDGSIPTKPHTTQHVRDLPLARGDRPVTMQVRATNHKPLSPRISPDSHIRSSSSSYHSASNYDDMDESSLLSYTSNIEHTAPRTLVHSPQRKKKRGRDVDAKDQLKRYSNSDYTSGSHSREHSTDHVKSRSASAQYSGSSSMASLGASASKPRATAGVSRQGDRLSSGRLSPGRLSPTSERLAQEYSEAVRVWDYETVERMLERGKEGGVDVDMVISEKDGRSAIMLAAAADQPKMVRILLEHKASVTARDKNGFTALYLACSHGNYEVMKLLVTAFADVNAVAEDGTPMLFTPAQKGFSMVTQYLLENDANPNLATRDGVTPLMSAARKGQRDVVKVLLANGADVTAVSVESSRTALQEAIDNGHQEIVSMLMSATKEAKEKSKQLFVCKSAEVVRSLVRDHPNVDERRGDQATPLIVQVENGNEEVVNELLVQGANVDLQDSKGESALMKASTGGYVRIAQLIIAHRAILDLKSKNGYTAMMYAAKEDHIGIVRELLLAGADATIRNNNGQTALEIAEEMGSEAMVEEIKKHSAIADSKDPFINLLSGYLEKFSTKQKPTSSSSSSVVVHKPTSEGATDPSNMQVARVVDSEDSPLRDQLTKAWKRIADLETRVHDLTLQSTMDISDETDLTYYDRNRLESEFRKVKELKHKAEQYAVEAKQTAQRLSAENFKLKEDLSRERHFNELERKNMLREMEAKIGQKGGEYDRDEAKKEIMQQTINQKAIELATTMRGTLEMRVTVDFEMIKELILNQTVDVNLALLMVAGLPYSGKSTVIRKVINANASSTSMQETLGFSALKTSVLRHEARNTSRWETCDIQATMVVAIALLRVSLQQHSFPNFPDQSSAAKKTVSVFGDIQLDQFFSTIFNKFPVNMLNDDNVRWMLTTGDVSFVNVWDLGMNKGVFDVMGMVIPECTNVVLLDFFSLDRDADTIDETPNLGAKCYNGRYKTRGDDQNLLTVQTKLEYLSYPMFIVPGDSNLLVATHSAQEDSEVKQKAKNVQQKVKMHIDSRKPVQSSVPRVIRVNHQKKEDIELLRIQIEKMISKFQVKKLSLKWVFLRTYLAFTKRMYISLPEVKTIAKKLHITDGEVTEFVTLFKSCGSFIYIGDLCPECADEFIILRPAEFMKEVEKMYYDGDERRNKGYISREFADALWSQSKCTERGGFFIHTLHRLGILAPLILRDVTSKTEYFAPRIRPKASQLKCAHSSLYIPHGVVFPFPLQLQFLEYFQKALFDIVDFDPTDCFNTLRFKNLTDKGSKHLTLQFMQMGGHIEVSGEGFDKEFRSKIKTACLEVMAGIQRKKPEMKLEYGLSVLCPNVQGSMREHFINIHPLEVRNVLFCDQCVSVVEVVGGSQDWIHAPYTGPRTLVQYHEDNLCTSETAEIVDALATLSFEELVDLAADLGFSRGEIEERMKRVPQKILIAELLHEFAKHVPCNVKKRLAKVLLDHGHLKEALKIYPAALYSELYKPNKAHSPEVASDRPSLRELRLVAMHLPDWEKLGKALLMDQGTLDHCKKSHRTMCEMAYQMLLKWREDSSKTRKELINSLKLLKCDSAADFLEIGEMDQYWK